MFEIETTTSAKSAKTVNTTKPDTTAKTAWRLFEPRAVFSDLDGSFLGQNKRIPQENIFCLDMLAKRGIEFVPCTGRNYPSIPEELLTHPAVHYVIACNGAQIFKLSSPECSKTNMTTQPQEGTMQKKAQLLLEQALDRDLVRQLYEDLKDCSELSFDIFADEHIYSDPERFKLFDSLPLDEHARAFIRSTRTFISYPLDVCFMNCESITRLNIFLYTDHAREFVEATLQRYPQFAVASSTGCNAEITRSDVNKGEAMNLLCNHLGLSTDKVMAFGDNTNDISMLSAAGHGVALQNAVEATKNAADAISPWVCDQAGVGRYVMQYLEDKE